MDLRRGSKLLDAPPIPRPAPGPRRARPPQHWLGVSYSRSFFGYWGLRSKVGWMTAGAVIRQGLSPGWLQQFLINSEVKMLDLSECH